MSNFTYIYHSDCEPSNTLYKLVNEKIKTEIDYINLKTDTIESTIEINSVPMLIVDNQTILLGKEAFDFVEKINDNKTNGKKRNNLYKDLYVAPPEDSVNKKRVTFE